MLLQHTCCIILPTRIVVGRQFLGGLDLFFLLGSTQTGVCCTEISALHNNMPHNTKHFLQACQLGIELAPLLRCSPSEILDALSFPPFDRNRIQLI